MSSPSEDPVAALARALARCLRGASPANDNTAEWVPLEAEAERRDKPTDAFRRWCEKHRVPIRQHNHRDAWVRRADVDAVIAGFPLASGPDPATEDLERELQKGKR